MERIDDAIDAEIDVALLLDEVTDTEALVCELLMRGWAFPEIAGHLGLSRKRVMNCLSQVRTQAMLMFPDRRRRAVMRKGGRSVYAQSGSKAA